MNTAPTFRERLRYLFDTSMSAGSVALVGWLALMTAFIIVIATVVFVVTGITPADDDDFTFVEAVWSSLMRTIDPGTIGGDQGWGFRMVMLVVTFAGIFLFSALIGVLSTGIEGKLQELRKGRSRVIEYDHTIILNWSPEIFDVLRALSIANESVHRPRIVILAAMDKVAMEDEIAEKALLFGRTKIICRTGDPSDLTDLQIVNPQTSRSIIILSPKTENSDAHVIKCIVALVNDPNRRAAPYRIAAEIKHAENSSIAHVVGGNETQLVLTDDLISRIMAHSSRQTGLSAAYAELLDFDGSEFYVLPQPDLAGLAFGDALMAYDTCIPAGLCDAAGRIEMNPPMDRIIAPDDRIVLIASDDSAIHRRIGPVVPATQGIATPPRHLPVPESYLILGWNDRGRLVIRELCRFMPTGSALTIVTDSPRMTDDALAGPDFDGVSIAIRRANITQIANLEKLAIGSYNSILVLGCSDDLPPQTADTHTLVTLLHLRAIADRDHLTINVVSEMIDVRNRKLAEVTRTDDFVVSSQLVSMMLAQASENPHANEIFAELLDAGGAELCLRPAMDYVVPGQPVDFFTVTEAARRAGQIAIGHAPVGTALTLNPVKSETRVYTPDDRIVIIARV